MPKTLNSLLSNMIPPTRYVCRIKELGVSNGNSLLLHANQGCANAQAFMATAYVFCAALQSVPAAARHSITFVRFALVQDTRPATSDWPATPSEGTHVYATIAVRYPLYNPSSSSVGEGGRPFVDCERWLKFARNTSTYTQVFASSGRFANNGTIYQ